MKLKSLIIIVLVSLLPMLGWSQITHEGELQNRLRIGRHVWKDGSGQIKAEVTYDAAGVVQSFRTWDDRGLLMDDVRMDGKRKREEFPPLDFTYDEDGFGFVLIAAHGNDDGPKARAGERVAVYYEGSLQDGTVFDSNYGGKKPFRFKFQLGEVVPGFDRAVEMLRVGEEGYFWIPASLGYGADAIGTIPPFSDLLFRIKLVDLN
jgi:FKBP-type peptidyl-prolyl cis-trans isomerase